VPDGVINLVQGARDTGAAALDDPDLDGVLFTGSWGTGSFIHKKFAGRTGVQLALEMGGNNPLVVWDAENADAAARIAILSAYITSGSALLLRAPPDRAERRWRAMRWWTPSRR
jgi:succinylglutamic semialdehyde dehydrogenase